MHVQTATKLSPDKVQARFASIGVAAADRADAPRKLRIAMDRKPAKVFLSGVPITLPAAAEVSIDAKSGGASVVLRLMWGPLPAPFPRAVAGVGLLLGVVVLIFSDRSVSAWSFALCAAAAPMAALLYQRRGERDLQHQLSRMLDGASFTPAPH